MYSLYGFERQQIEAVNKGRSWTVPYFRPGDTLCVGTKIKEGNKFRVQRFEGLCMARSRSTTRVHSSFVLRKTQGGDAVEQLFRIYSPCIEYIQVMSYGKVRRAKLNYLRSVFGKKARVPEDLSFTKKMQNRSK